LRVEQVVPELALPLLRHAVIVARPALDGKFRYIEPMSRIDAIRKILDSSPNDPFPRYGLAMELRNAGRLDDAHAEFDELERRHPDYVPAYLMHLNVLAGLKRKDEARAVGERGLAAARKKGDHHAANELEAAVEALEYGD
jgi:hypothetical protein